MLAIGLCGAPMSVGRAAPVASEAAPDLAELERLYAAGEASFAAGDLDAAIASFGAGLDALGEEGPARLRAYFSVSLAIALLDRFDASADDADAERAHALLTATIDEQADVLRAEPRLEALARRNLARADASRPPPDPVPEPEPEPEPDPDPDPDADPVAAPDPDPVPDPDPRIADDAATAKRRRMGIGLLVAGTAVTAGAIAVVLDGATLRRRALAIAEDPPTTRQQQYIDDEVPRLARIRYAIAGPSLALGAGLILGGAIALRRASQGRVTLAPTFGPAHAGVTLRASF